MRRWTGQGWVSVEQEWRRQASKQQRRAAAGGGLGRRGSLISSQVTLGALSRTFRTLPPTRPPGRPQLQPTPELQSHLSTHQVAPPSWPSPGIKMPMCSAETMRLLHPSPPPPLRPPFQQQAPPPSSPLSKAGCLPQRGAVCVRTTPVHLGNLGFWRGEGGREQLSAFQTPPVLLAGMFLSWVSI